MKLLEQVVSKGKEALSDLKELQISAKGNAEISLHTKSSPDQPKAKVEVVEDGKTVNVTDLLLVGTAIMAAGAVFSILWDFLD